MKKSRTPDWVSFICTEGNVPALIEAKNHGGGIYKGMAFYSWAFDGDYFAIWNMAGNPVWCHKKNFKVLSRGTVKGLPAHIRYVHDWKDFMKTHREELKKKISEYAKTLDLVPL